MKWIRQTLILVFAIIFSLTSLFVYANANWIVGLDNFELVKTYESGTFSDVSDTAWYVSNVKTAYEYGLMEGTSQSVFNPNGNLTLAAAIIIASRINGIYYYGFPPLFEDVDGEPWEYSYTPYINYAKGQNIIKADYLNYSTSATRAEFAKILAAAINPLEFEEINRIDDGAIPDVPANADYADAVYMLYRAGVLTGSDATGKFNPNSTITRAAAAAIITRIIDPDLRQAVELNGSY